MKQAVCVLIKAGEYYLAVTRLDSKMSGLVGGKVDPGETTLQAIVREVQEEVGLSLNPSWLREVFTQVCPGEVDYLTTTYTYPDMSLSEISKIVAEDGLIAVLISKKSLCDNKVSPFADYNRSLFAAMEKL
jgi:8-oxo-dGTP pyrophosphatase MutT (NUDIX family)